VLLLGVGFGAGWAAGATTALVSNDHRLPGPGGDDDRFGGPQGPGQRGDRDDRRGEDSDSDDQDDSGDSGSSPG
jgi:hypothetical protein